MIVRSFLPVGQGAFYMEQFGDAAGRLNIIYDCGSISKSQTIPYTRREIENNLRCGETIHAVFISHMHADHINGLEYLFKNYDVKNVFIPYTSMTNKKILLLKYISDFGEYNDFCFRFIDDPRSVIDNGDTSIYQVKPYHGDKENNTYAEKIRNINDDNGYRNIEAIDSGNVNSIVLRTESNTHREHFFRGYEWEFVTYSFNQYNVIDMFLRKLQNAFNTTIDQIDMQAIIGNKNSRDTLKNIYKGINKDINLTSMAMFSGVRSYELKQLLLPCENYSSSYICDMCCSDHDFWNMPFRYMCGLIKANGCLYTGDYCTKDDAHWRELRNAFADHWDHIGCIQIPHHGSKHSYRKELAMQNAYYVISAGQHNRYKHPHSEVMKDILEKGCSLHVVTECEDSCKRFVILV